MIKMINVWTKTEMFVADDRVNEYLAAGCVLAAGSVAAKAEPVKEQTKAPVKKAPAKKATAKPTAKKK